MVFSITSTSLIDREYSKFAGTSTGSESAINVVVSGGIHIGSVSANVDSVYIQSGDNLNITSLPIATTLTGGSAIVAASGTAMALGTSLVTKSIYVGAIIDNSSFVCVGDSNVDKDTNQQIVLYAGDSAVLDITNRSAVYVDADENDDGVNYLAFS